MRPSFVVVLIAGFTSPGCGQTPTGERASFVTVLGRDTVVIESFVRTASHVEGDMVIRVPATFPPDPVEDGHMLSGLGVPDMRGRIGTPAFYTSDPAWQMGDNEFSVELLHLPARRGRVASGGYGA